MQRLRDPRAPAVTPGAAASRRLFLGRFAAASFGALAASCATRTSHPSRAGLPRLRRLAPVAVSRDARIRQVVGHRPYRASGFVVRGEKLDEKLLVQNYGHGGGGISLSWGSAQVALEIARAAPLRRAAVIGCGALGLSSARLLQDAGFDVTLYARDLPPHTTSNVAGGLWDPFAVSAPGRTTAAYDAQFERATRLAYRRFQDLVGARYGVRWIEALFVGDEPLGDEGVVFELLRPTHYGPGQHPFPARHVTSVFSMLIEPTQYLPALIDDFRGAGGRIVVREFKDRSDLNTLPEPLIVNCTGLGSRELLGDLELEPAKGQLEVLRPAPELDYVTLGPGPGVLYMIPRSDGVLLGGSFGLGDSSSDPDRAESDRILESHARVNAALASAQPV
ncbi:MAG TPA: FAD-dependent oxidoreductase [Vicinamibacteria bacterium]|nr:FAD-dependent oxidoreductase [Vicinamibacteria bacterium]